MKLYINCKTALGFCGNSECTIKVRHRWVVWGMSWYKGEYQKVYKYSYCHMHPWQCLRDKSRQGQCWYRAAPTSDLATFYRRHLNDNSGWKRGWYHATIANTHDALCQWQMRNNVYSFVNLFGSKFTHFTAFFTLHVGPTLPFNWHAIVSCHCWTSNFSFSVTRLSRAFVLVSISPTKIIYL